MRGLTRGRTTATMCLPGHLGRRAAAHVLAACLMAASPVWRLAASAGPAEIMACVARDCRAELGSCVANPTCARGLACLGANYNNPVGQVRCMDLYENVQMRTFADCAMTKNKCLEPLAADATEARSYSRARAAIGRSPPRGVPSIDRLLRGSWKVALGLNPAFDTFDCQVHVNREPIDWQQTRNPFAGHQAWLNRHSRTLQDSPRLHSLTTGLGSSNNTQGGSARRSIDARMLQHIQAYIEY